MEIRENIATSTYISVPQNVDVETETDLAIDTQALIANAPNYISHSADNMADNANGATIASTPAITGYCGR